MMLVREQPQEEEKRGPPSRSFTILLIGSDPQVIACVSACLEKRGYQRRLATTGPDGLKLHREEGADLVIVSLPTVGTVGSELLRQLKNQDTRASIVVTGRDSSVRGASDALGLGAVEYLDDPTRDANELLSILGVALGARRTDAQLRYLRQKDASGAGWQVVLGESPTMRKVFQVVRQICDRTSTGSTPTILIAGETGTGKGLLAKTIHYNSVRRSRAFVDINCAAIPSTLLEAELFGYERGAFTDARATRVGLMETADGGSLFLDEISTIPLELQAKLLTAIEDKKIRRLGGRQPIRVDVQVVAATHRDLATMARANEFRADLYHRLNVLAVNLPPLRERGEDRLFLAETFIASMCQEYGIPVRRLSEEARQAINNYSWPGNVRELRNQIERILLLHDEDPIQAEHFHLGALTTPQVAFEKDGRGVQVVLPEGGCPLEEIERAVLRQALEKCRGNVSAAARYLSISRQTLIYRMKKHGLSEPRDGEDGEAGSPGLRSGVQ
ncbi:MAG: sigma-54 dependent transcriptional regulator [Pseudomonadota bacterium]